VALTMAMTASSAGSKTRRPQRNGEPTSRSDVTSEW
jgi:hypothetical protein